MGHGWWTIRLPANTGGSQAGPEARPKRRRRSRALRKPAHPPDALCLRLCRRLGRTVFQQLQQIIHTQHARTGVFAEPLPRRRRRAHVVVCGAGGWQGNAQAREMSCCSHAGLCSRPVRTPPRSCLQPACSLANLRHALNMPLLDTHLSTARPCLPWRSKRRSRSRACQSGRPRQSASLQSVGDKLSVQ